MGEGRAILRLHYPTTARTASSQSYCILDDPRNNAETCALQISSQFVTIGMLRRRLHSASVPAKLSDLHFGAGFGGEDGLAIGEPEIKPVSSMHRVMSLTRICEDRHELLCEDRHELLACTDSAPDVPNWVLALRISSGSSGSGKSTLFADTAALDAEDASKSPPSRPRHRRSVSSPDARAVAKAACDSLKVGLPSGPL